MLESAGVSTVQLASIRSYVERMRPPRALYCEFPLGLPLGVPGDGAFQHRVLDAALALLERRDVPALEDFSERITDASDEPLACQLPPRFDPRLHPAVDEAVGLRPAYERQLARSRRTNVGHKVGASGVPDVIRAFVRIADGMSLADAGLPDDPRTSALDVRAYYEESALALADHVPAARQADAWFFRTTESGRLLKRAQTAMRDAGVPFEVWFCLVPIAHWDDKSPLGAGGAKRG